MSVHVDKVKGAVHSRFFNRLCDSSVFYYFSLKLSRSCFNFFCPCLVVKSLEVNNRVFLTIRLIEYIIKVSIDTAMEEDYWLKKPYHALKVK